MKTIGRHNRRLETLLAATTACSTYFPLRRLQMMTKKKEVSVSVTGLGISRRKSEKVKFNDEKSWTTPHTWTSFREEGLRHRAKIWTNLSPMRSPFLTLDLIDNYPWVLLQGRYYQNMVDGRIRISCLVHQEKAKRYATSHVTNIFYLNSTTPKEMQTNPERTEKTRKLEAENRQ